MESLKVVLTGVISILMMSAKLATPGLNDVNNLNDEKTLRKPQILNSLSNKGLLV